MASRDRQTEQQLQRLVQDLSDHGVCIVRNARGVALRGPATPDLVERAKRLKPAVEAWLAASYSQTTTDAMPTEHAVLVQKALRIFWGSRIIA